MRVQITDSVFQEAVWMIHRGLMVSHVARKLNISYSHLYGRCKTAGISCGVRRQNNRPIIDRIRDAIDKTETGCWLWVGRKPGSFTNDPNYRGTRNCARALAGLPADLRPRRHTPISLCGNLKCINPEHEGMSVFEKRNSEIVQAWKESEEAKKLVFTLESLGEKYGLTRQRILQILEHYA